MLGTTCSRSIRGDAEAKPVVTQKRGTTCSLSIRGEVEAKPVVTQQLGTTCSGSISGDVEAKPVPHGHPEDFPAVSEVSDDSTPAMTDCSACSQFPHRQRSSRMHPTGCRAQVNTGAEEKGTTIISDATVDHATDDPAFNDTGGGDSKTSRP